MVIFIQNMVFLYDYKKSNIIFDNEYSMQIRGCRKLEGVSITIFENEVLGNLFISFNFCGPKCCYQIHKFSFKYHRDMKTSALITLY